MKIPNIPGRNFNLPIQNKNFECKDLTVDEEKRKVSGYLAVFGNIDSDGDILMKGCFAKSIRERGPQSATNGKIAFLFMHDVKDPIGKFTTLKEEDYGLYFEAILDEGVPSADRVLIQLKSGTLNQFSIGFQYIWDKCEWDQNSEALIVKEVNLFEGSVVTLAANDMTYFAGMKAAQKQKKKDELLKETEIFIKSLPSQFQFEARQMVAKNINLAIALKKKDDQSTAEDDETDNGDLKCIKDAMGNLQDGIDICDDYADDIENSDLAESIKCMKESHMGHLEKMGAHLTIMGKSLKVTQAGKPPVTREPNAVNKSLFNNLTLV